MMSRSARFFSVHSPVCTCPSCGTLARVRRPSSLRKLGVVGGWVLTAMMIGMFSLIGPFMVVLSPVLFLGGLGVVTSVHVWADAAPTCAACGAVRLEAEAAVEPRRQSRPDFAAATR